MLGRLILARLMLALICGLVAVYAIPSSAGASRTPHLEVVEGHVLQWEANNYCKWVVQAKWGVANVENETIGPEQGVSCGTVAELPTLPPSRYSPDPKPGQIVLYRVKVKGGVNWSNEVTIIWL
jgi:hypothetical protein